VEFDARIPIYLQIMEKIKKDIVTGQLKRGDKMPSVRVLAGELQVNVNTVQRVYQELEREEVIITQRGIGSFVTEDEKIILKIKRETAYQLLENFVRGMRELGYDFETTLASLKEYMEGEANGNIKGAQPD
jgi:GntR family transcriptional regulator